ncbi:ISAzo13 family transposase [Actinomadura madurae]|uniref:ISAzo13 family transposase n=1 Tax=Actinomadura madurae TaxID=1993 RepID=UPI000D8CCB21|nr:ISAzo13 family transposase [Actinomadura madurae]SPT49844.1 Rhodopirellula transposase [Actinomadura madurae]SPT63101.1 Rhodopirellula transposase [Actinomadura madurae]
MAIPSGVRDQLAARFAVLLPHLNERQRRLALATEARLLGHGGVRLVAQVAGVSETTVRKGVFELESGADPLPEGRVRRAGGGRLRAEAVDPLLLPALLALVEPDERGDPESALRWTTKSLRHLAGELSRQGHRVTAPTVGRLLKESGFSLQGTAKTLEGDQHPDRDAQFRYINAQVKEHQAVGEPVVSVDAKKKEQLGLLPMGGREWRPRGQPVEVEDHAFFVGPHVETVVPYGIYDMTANTGWVNVGVDHDTAAFAVASIRRWWQARGRLDYPQASRLLITADAGGSNSYRYRLWKAELAAFAAETGLTVTVCHFPPGTSKWNKIEHRLFSHITMNWRGRPLTSHQVVLNTIAATTTSTGLRVQAALDPGSYPTGIAVSRDQADALPITAHTEHGRWNYSIAPASGAYAPPRADQRAATRAQTLLMLADPRLTGMSGEEFDVLRCRLAPAQAARAEQRRYVLRGGRRVATTGRSRALLSDADEVLVTIIYLRQVCPQKVLCDLLGINPVTIGQAIKATRQLLDEQKITITPSVVRYFARADDLRAWVTGTDPDAHVPASPTRHALTDPHLTGMSRDALHALLEELIVPYAAAIEQRRHRQRGGDRRPGSRGGVFRQKITDGDRILATILYQRRVCTLHTLAELFDISRSTLWNAINDVLPILDAHHVTITPADQHHASAADLLASTSKPTS